jgi:hypothetical protein
MTATEAERAISLRADGLSYGEIANRMNRSRNAVIKLLQNEASPKTGDPCFRCPQCGGLSAVSICRPCSLRKRHATEMNRQTAVEWLDQIAASAWDEYAGN